MNENKKKNIEHYEKRFGIMAIEKGFINSDDLLNALKIQVREDMEGNIHRLVGEIFLDLDLMSADQIQDVLKDLFK